MGQIKFPKDLCRLFLANHLELSVKKCNLFGYSLPTSMPDKVTKSAAPSFLRAKRKNAGSPSHGPSVQGHTPQSQRKANIQAKINQSGIQTKLKVTPANDPSEREADHMASRLSMGKKVLPWMEPME